MRGRFFLLLTLLPLWGCRPSDRVVARANGVTVTASEVQQVLWQRYGSVTVRELLTQKLLEREAKRRGIEVTDAEVTRTVKERHLPDTAEVQRQVRAELLLEKLAHAMAKVSEAEARRYFEQHRAEFELPERVRLRDITLESRENAQAIWQALQLRQGTNFADLARHFSTNPMTRQRGGDMGIIPLQELHPKLRTLVQKMKVGEISPPLEIDGEWVIVKLEARFPSERKTFEQVREEVMARLKRQKVWQWKAKLPEQLWRQAKVRILDPSLRQVH